MKLYLLRHAEAHPGLEDAQRPLTGKGKQSLHILAQHLKRIKPLKISEIRHSTLVRAKQTAALLLKETGWNLPLHEVPLLKPEDEVQTLAEILEEEQKSVLLVGHNPHLERLTGLLVCGDPEALPVEIKKSTLLCLSRPKPGLSPLWRIQWVLSPRVQPGKYDENPYK